MDVPLSRGLIVSQIETCDGADISDAVCLPRSIAAQYATPPSVQDAYGARSTSITGMPEEIILLVNQMLDWRDSVRLGATCVDVRCAMGGPLSLYAGIARTTDVIHRWQGSKWLSQFSAVLVKIDALPWGSRPSALQLFVQRIAHRERDYHAAFQEGSIYALEAIAVWRTRQEERACMANCRARWVETETAIKRPLRDMPPSFLRHAALRQLCFAKAYLPWLGLVPNPRKHLSEILKDLVTLPYSEWTDILNMLRPLLGVPIFRQLTWLFHDFATRVEEVHSAIPPLLLTDILNHLTLAGDPGVARYALHKRFAVSAGQDPEPIVAAVAQNIVDATLARHKNHSVRPDALQRNPSRLLLRRLTGWDIEDALLAKQVNRCFVRSIAAQPSHCAADWSSLPLAMRHHYETKVLGVPIDTVEGWGCSRVITSVFWPIYLDITGASDFIGTTAVWQKIMLAPWQLQGALLHQVWKCYVARSVDFDDDFASRISSRCTEWEARLSAQALIAGEPALALRGIRASVQWQSSCGKERAGDWTSHERWNLDAGRPVYPWISIAGISVIKATPPALRMVLIGVLSEMRPTVVDEGYLWCFDTVVFSSLRDLLCDPGASLVKPSWKMVYAISNVIASVWPAILDVGDEHVSRFDRVATRLDLKPEARDHVWLRVLMHLVIQIKSKQRTFEETVREGDASTRAEQLMLLDQLSRTSS